MRARSVLTAEHAWNRRQLNFGMSFESLRPLATDRHTDCSCFLAHVYRPQIPITSFACPAGGSAAFCAPLLVQLSLPFGLPSLGLCLPHQPS